MAKKLALLRAINVGGRKVPMAELRALCADLGWTDVATYIQSGNIVFAAPGGDAAVEEALEKALAARFGFEVPVIVRTADEWAGYAAGSPFPEVETTAPNALLLAASKRPLSPGAAEALQERARDGELVREKQGALWVHFAGGIARSKLTPALFDKLAGSPVTARNWRTVVTLHEMLRA